MTLLASLLKTEERALGSARSPRAKARGRVAGLFGMVVLGILAKSFFDTFGGYLRTSHVAVDPPGFGEVAVRVVLALIIAGVTFTSIYSKVNQATSQTNLPYVLAFQSGFFWQALLDSVEGG